jgi:branched-chain amino acid transport system ATP-binding protein
MGCRDVVSVFPDFGAIGRAFGLCRAAPTVSPQNQDDLMLSIEGVGRRFQLWAVRVSRSVSAAARPALSVRTAPTGPLFQRDRRAVTSSGEIRFLGSSITNAKPYQVARLGLARTFQIPKPFKQLSVGENVMLSALRRHRSTRRAAVVAADAMRFVAMEHLADNSIASLTVGLLKKLELARALATEPSLLLLDEVMAGLTPREITELMAAIRSLPERGVTVVWIEHVMMALMKVAQRVIVMQQGKVIAQGSPAEIAMNPAVIGAYLGETYVHAAHG